MTENDPFGDQHISNYTHPKRELVIFQQLPVEQVENNIVNPECNCRHCHCIASHHPHFMGYDISFMDRGQSVQGGHKPPARHEHKQASFPKTTLGKKGHVQTGRGTHE